jgi:oligopeptide/dipeptide ABC transporter ATP-binding protein
VAPLLSVRDLRLSLTGPAGPVTPVDGVSLELAAGECVGLVGESGCGKSLSALTLLGLSRSLPGAQVSGAALWQPEAAAAPRDLLELPEAALLKLRGREIGMVFQDPLSCLNPLLTAGYQIGEVLRAHTPLRGAAARARTEELLALCGVPQPALRARQYPHQLSGGLRQRVLLAVALAAGPRLLIADEPTTALDVTIQAQVLATLRELQRAQGLAVLFITHDLGVVAQLCSRVLVMYAGRIVESASAEQFFSAPRHPYSRALLASLPRLHEQRERGALASIPGAPPQPGRFPAGCRFHPRCPQVMERCRSEYPPDFGQGESRVACWLEEE